MEFNIREFFRSDKSNWLWLLFALLALVLTARNLMLPDKEFMTHYNNYIIFKQSFFHLFSGSDLYAAYPNEHYDLYKYTPTFALFMGLLAWMPDAMGLACWNLLNVLALVYAVKKLPGISNTQKIIFGLLILQETITTTMNSQSNTLIAALLILGWIALENGTLFKAVICILLTVFIKIFGLVFFILFLFYPKWYKSILPAIALFLLLLLLPLPILGFSGLKHQYLSYFNLLQNDHGNFVKYSVMGWIQNWFHVQPDKNLVLIFGLTLQIIPAIAGLFFKKIFQFKPLRAIYAASWLIWMVIFNHMAESATYIIAVAGVLIWFFYTGIPKWPKIILLLPVILFTCFGPSDIYPPALRENIVIHWQLKVFPCILVWFFCILEMVFTLRKPVPETMEKF